MDAPRQPSPPPEQPEDDPAQIGDVFADLVPIDVVDGELVPRRATG